MHNKFAEVLTFLQMQRMPKLIGKNDHPRFIEQEVDLYEDEELSKFHAICSSYHSTLYDFLLMSGFRDQEAMHVLWSNLRSNSVQLDAESLQGAGGSGPNELLRLPGTVLTACGESFTSFM